MVDRPRLEKLLARSQHYVAALRRLGDVEQSSFLTDEDKVGNAKYQFVIAIESCIDIANHIVAAEGWRVPVSNADVFAVLVEQGVVPAAQLTSLETMARFRNRLVHMYAEIEDALVHDYLRDHVGVIETFAIVVARWLEGEP